MYQHSVEKFLETILNFLSSIIPDYFWVIFLLLVDVLYVVVFESAVLELPCNTMVLPEILLILVHVLLENLLPSRLKVDLLGNFIWDVSKINADLYKV